MELLDTDEMSLDTHQILAEEGEKEAVAGEKDAGSRMPVS